MWKAIFGFEVKELYHGRPDKVEILLPEQAYDTGLEIKDNLLAIYATPFKEVAALFSWHSLKVPNFTYSRPGYIYKLDTKDFEPLDEFQVVSLEPRVPISFELSWPLEYLDTFLNNFTWLGLKKLGPLPLIHNFNIMTKREDIKKLIEGIDVTACTDLDVYKIAKNQLHNELIKLKDNFDKGLISGKDLRDFMEKLDSNWSEFIE